MKIDRPSQSGFTLIEAVIVIVITGVLAGVVAVFIGNPVRGYGDTVRRAELTDAADVALRRISRDVRLALPNSLRVTSDATNFYIEFIMTSAGGRYRDAADGSTDLNPLTVPDCDSLPTPAKGPCFLDYVNSTNVSFDVLGVMPTMPTINAGDFIVVYNLGPGYEPANAYNYNIVTDACRANGCNIAKVDAVGGNTVTLHANPFAAQSPPLPSPNNRFQVVPGGVRAVSYVCPRNISGNVTRVWNYGFQPAQAAPPVGGSSAILVGRATCLVDYSAGAGRNGLLFIQLTLRSETTPDNSIESATLFQQIHVDNSP